MKDRRFPLLRSLLVFGVRLGHRRANGLLLRSRAPTRLLPWALLIMVTFVSAGCEPAQTRYSGPGWSVVVPDSLGLTLMDEPTSDGSRWEGEGGDLLLRIFPADGSIEEYVDATRDWVGYRVVREATLDLMGGHATYLTMRSVPPIPAQVVQVALLVVEGEVVSVSATNLDPEDFVGIVRSLDVTVVELNRIAPGRDLG
jgi:hypothetical protein